MEGLSLQITKTVTFILLLKTLRSDLVAAKSLPGVKAPSLPSISGLPSLPNLNWQAEAEKLWDSHKDRFSYCIGDKLSDALDLLKASFPVPLLTDNSDSSGICSNETAIHAHLCGPQEIAIYLKFLLLTANVEKIPSNFFCDVGNEAEACAPGFFQMLSADLNPLAPKVVKPQPCCPGYFCPAMLTCMLPCPYGSICPRAYPADPPTSYLESDPDIRKPLLGKADKWCAPYGYKLRRNLGCGGADKWSIQPSGAFPTQWTWEGGSGSIFCTGGSYCPNPVTQLPCKAGHFCKQGSSTATACPALTGCPAGTETPTDNWLGFALDGVLFLLLGSIWHASQVYHRLTQRLGRRERVRIMWHKMAPQVTVVQVADEHQPRWPITSQAGAGLNSSSSSTAGVATAAAAAASLEDGSSSVAATGSRFGFIRDLARRRSRAGAAPVWASFNARDSQVAPLLEFEMQQGEDGARHAHRRSVSGLTIAPNTMLTLHPIPKALNPVGKIRPGGPASSASTDSGEFIPVWHHASTGSEGLSNSGTAAGGLGGSGSSKPLLEVGFQNLSMTLKSCRKQVLQGITGQFKHSHVTALMGPSGAGKTTLMNALAGKASYGVVSGTITINGKPGRLTQYKRLMGFVPQDDIMYRNLTVEENLMYSARVRLPASTTPAHRLEVVASTIAVLGLADVRHAVIGDEEVRGISGGQRKRVNVGIELVSDPSLLFLDEPTSGLDSTASKLVVQGLTRVAQTGMTVTAVIHQPSYETFCLFDDLVLLAKGGLTAYYGPQRDVQSYFETLGFDIPEHMNPADAYLDIISGGILPKSGQALDIPACWKAQEGRVRDAGEQHYAAAVTAAAPELLRLSDDNELQETGAEAVAVTVGSRRTSTMSGHRRSSSISGVSVVEVPTQSLAARAVHQAGELLAGIHSILLLWLAVVSATVHDAVSSARNAVAEQLYSWASSIAARGYRSSRSGSAQSAGPIAVPVLTEHSHKRRPPGFWKQFYWILTRAVLMRSREPILLFTEYTIFAVVGSFLGLMSDRGRGSIASYVGNVVYNIVALGLMAMVSGIKTFGGPERVVYYREAAAGLNKLAYFWALDTWSHVGMLLRCAVYLIMYYTFSQPRAVVWQMYVVTCAIYYACTGMAYLLSQVMAPNAAQLTAAVAALINALVASKFETTGVMGALNQISYARWGLEGYVLAEANCLTGVWLLARCADLAVFSYDVTRFWYAMRTLVYIGFGSRLAACLGLLLLHRDKTV